MKNLLVGLVLIFLTACSDSGGGISGEGNTNLPPDPSGGSNPNLPPDSSEESNPNLPPDPSEGSNPNLPPDPSEGSNPNLPPDPSEGSNPNSPPDPSEGSNPNSPPDPSGGSNPNLPPDPGEAGKLTIEGIDSDSDGVRDDIQRYIAIEYPDTEKIRRVFTHMVKANQDFIINADDIEKVLEARQSRSKQISCLLYIDLKGGYAKSKKIKAELLNTEARTRAYIKANSHLGGMTFRIANPNEWKAQCSFDPDLLEN